MSDYDTNAQKMEDILLDIDNVKETYELRVIRSLDFGPCYTLIPK